MRTGQPKMLVAALAGMLALGDSLAPSQRDIRVQSNNGMVGPLGWLNGLTGFGRGNRRSRPGKCWQGTNKFKPNMQGTREIERRRWAIVAGRLQCYGWAT